MEISLKHGPASKLKTPCIIAAVHDGKILGACAASLDQSSQQALSRLTTRGDISGKLAEIVTLHECPGLAADRVLLIGAGKQSGITGQEYVKLVRKAASSTVAASLKSATSALTEVVVKDRDNA